jgi:hypothetical protein
LWIKPSEKPLQSELFWSESVAVYRA